MRSQPAHSHLLEGHNGVMIDGAFAEYHVVDSRNSCHVPDNVSLASAAPLACAGCTIYRSIIVSGVKKGGWIAIVGAGGGLGMTFLCFLASKPLLNRLHRSPGHSICQSQRYSLRRHRCSRRRPSGMQEGRRGAHPGRPRRKRQDRGKDSGIDGWPRRRIGHQRR